ncbi:MAG: helicase-related protein [Hyphomicrobiales bacterium]
MPTLPQTPAHHPRARNVTVVLGPTNTGKTHLAVERMLSHDTGMIGLPLRLLAREIYDKVVDKCGAHAAALITGEEKIVPAEPRYFICTVEAMPSDIDVDFLAIDEVQLSADLERGHIFTDRLLHRRGQTETMMLGAGTMRTLIERLLPGAHFISRARFSRLTYSGQKKITRLPPRSAIVCFSADNVYATAELIRRQRGGAAVVMGALSPRTRNAQVALYQSGDVDFLVATDAIGMGLNMDIDHVAFAATRKFDGHMFRGLTPAELAQVAGRAGRHMNDGTFGVTGEAEPFEPDVIEQLENHQFEPVRMLQWRNRHLDFDSVDGLIQSLNKPPSMNGLTRSLRADDMAALEFLSRDPEIRELTGTSDAVHMLWDVCQIPDYRNITGGDHATLIGRVFRFLSSGAGTIPDDWFGRQISYAEHTDGDIDTLSNRIAHIRTWTYIANKSGWLNDPAAWQQRTRLIEDKLSDALHERLAQRFIDRRTSVLMKRMREKERLMASVSDDGDITVEGEFVGHLKGFHFIPDTSADGAHGRALRAASLKAVAAQIAAKAQRFVQAPDDTLDFTLEGGITWEGVRIARLVSGDHILKPRVQLIADDQLTGTDRQNVQARIEKWLADRLSTHLEPLLALQHAEDVDGMARGLAFQLVENLGVLVRDDVAEDVRALDQPTRATLRKYGIRFGAYHIFMPLLLKPAATRLKLLLWGLAEESQGRLELANLPEPPQQGLTSAATDASVPEGYYRVVGFRACGPRVVRIDMLERLSDLVRPLVFWKPSETETTRPPGSVEGGGFLVLPDMMSLVGCSGDEFSAILRSLGFRMEQRKIAAPDAEAAVGAAPEASPEPPAPDEAAAPAAAADAPAQMPAPDTDAAATPDMPAATADAPASAGTGGEAAEEAGPPDHIEVWWPRKAKRQGRPPRKTGQGAAGKGKERKGRPPKKPDNRSKKPPKRPPEPPADSPFAALGALKASLEKKQRTGS